MSEDIFETKEEVDNYLEQLVGEGKKFKDPEALARGKAESDKFIEDLKRQNLELKEDLDKASKLEELLEEVRSQKKAANASEGGNDGLDGRDGPSKTSSDLTDEQIKALIESTLSQREVESRAKRNLAEVNSTLSEKFGSKAAEHLKVKAQEVGLTVDKMKELAADNPKAFYRLIGLDSSTSDRGIVVGGDKLNSEGGPSQSATTRKDFNYYQELRRKSKGRYYSPEVQQEMFNSRKAMGDAAFYGRN